MSEFWNLKFLKTLEKTLNSQVKDGRGHQLQSGEDLTMWLLFIFYLFHQHTQELTLKVDWAEFEAWKGDGMTLPAECFSSCVYRVAGDDSGC